MTTVIDVITRSLREISVLAQNQTATAFMGQQGLEDLKAMIAEWELDGIAIGDASDWIATTVIPLPQSMIDPIMYNLALRETGKYGKTPKPSTAEFAGRGYRALQAAYGSLIDMNIPSGIGRRGYGYYGRGW